MPVVVEPHISPVRSGLKSVRRPSLCAPSPRVRQRQSRLYARRPRHACVMRAVPMRWVCFDPVWVTPTVCPSGPLNSPMIGPPGAWSGPSTRDPPRLSAPAPPPRRRAHRRRRYVLGRIGGSTDAAANAGAVDEAIAHPRVRDNVDLPVEQVGVVVLELCRVGPHDSETPHRLSHGLLLSQWRTGRFGPRVRLLPIGARTADACLTESGSATSTRIH
jgi:hypothetical protein